MKGEKMNGQFPRDVNTKTDLEDQWLQMRECDMKIETEILTYSAQKQALSINYGQNSQH